MDSRGPVVERDQLGVLPVGRHERHQVRELLKAVQKEQVGIPVAPIVPPAGCERGSVNLLAGGVASLEPAERQYDRRGLGFRAQYLERMLQILPEHENQQSGNAQVAEGPPFESAAGGPRLGGFSFERLPETGYLRSRFRQRSRVSAKRRRWRPRRNRHFVLNLLSLPIAHVMTRLSGRPKARGRSRNLSVGTGRVYSVERRSKLLATLDGP